MQIVTQLIMLKDYSGSVGFGPCMYAGSVNLVFNILSCIGIQDCKATGGLLSQFIK